jgi:hypothetical protein
MPSYMRRILHLGKWRQYEGQEGSELTIDTAAAGARTI